MKDIKKITVYFIAALFFLITIYDVFAIVKGGVEASISHTMIIWAYKFPIFPFFMGVLCGHLFWRMGDTKETKAIADSINADKEKK